MYDLITIGKERTKQNINKVARYFKNELLDNNLKQKHQEQQQKQHEKSPNSPQLHIYTPPYRLTQPS